MTTKKFTKFPLPNATKPRYIVSKKIEINQLPDDILLYIFRFLSPIDLLNIGIVCQRWHSISQDESLWHSLVISYGLHQISSILTNKQRIQNYLNQQIKTQLKRFFSIKFDSLTSYTGIPDYQKIFNKHSDQFHFLLTFCDDKHNILLSKKCDTMKFFDTSMSIRWLEINNSDIFSRVHYLRLFSVISIEINTRPNRLRLPKTNEQLSDITQKPFQHIQHIQSLLHEYSFNWNLIKRKSLSLTNDLQSPISITNLSNDDDCLIAKYEQDQSFAFIVFNINYLSYREQFFTGLRLTTITTTNQSLSQIFFSQHFPQFNEFEVSVYICFRNMTTIFLRHRFLHCRLKHSNSLIIELIRTTDMTKELGPELEQLPKFNWKTNLFKGIINDLFLIDIIVLNEHKNVSFSMTIPATLTSEIHQENDYILSSNVWNIKAVSQYNNRIHLDGTIMRLDSEYCALGKDEQSWHLQNMIFGDQSVGKSSVLDALNGVQLLRAQNICTRGLLELHMKNISSSLDEYATIRCDSVPEIRINDCSKIMNKVTDCERKLIAVSKIDKYNRGIGLDSMVLKLVLNRTQEEIDQNIPFDIISINQTTCFNSIRTYHELIYARVHDVYDNDLQMKIEEPNI